MKKFIIVGAIFILTLQNANAVEIANCCATYVANCSTEYSSSCTNSIRCRCPEGTTFPDSTTHVYSITSRRITSYCDANNKIAPTCTTYKTTYACDDGYYGTPTGNVSGACKSCPTNATCAKGNNSTFICNEGYYKNGSTCTKCPISDGMYGTTATGATSITGCYMPANTVLSDTIGDYTYTGDCYYVN